MVNHLIYRLEAEQTVWCRSFWLPEGSASKKNQAVKPSELFWKLLSEAGLEANTMAHAEQVHGGEVAVVDQPGVYPRVDGLITDRPGLTLGIRTADCAAVMVYDPVNRVIGNFHVGWRGAKAKILERGFNLMSDTFGSETEHLVVVVSPFIHECCYQVGPEFLEKFPGKYVFQRGGFHDEGPWFLDLPQLILDQLKELGVKDSHIDISEHCTHCSNMKFPSYRRNQTANRMVNLIKMKESD